MPSAYIGLGSNLGHPEENLALARAELEKLSGVRIEAVSSVYFTEPQGLREQPWFANQVVKMAVEGLTPLELLDCLLAIETSLGRVRSADSALRFGPRHIDLDLLLFGEHSCATPRLILPHPRLTERAFVLIPLRDVAPDLHLAGKRSLDAVLAALPYVLDGKKIMQRAGEFCE